MISRSDTKPFLTTPDRSSAARRRPAAPLPVGDRHHAARGTNVECSTSRYAAPSRAAGLQDLVLGNDDLAVVDASHRAPPP